jgi:hypothetical protein
MVTIPLRELHCRLASSFKRAPLRRSHLVPRSLERDAQRENGNTPLIVEYGI